MSISEILEKISIGESALKNAGPDAALNAVFDVLKEVAKELAANEEPLGKAPTPKILQVPETGGRKFRKEQLP